MCLVILWGTGGRKFKVTAFSNFFFDQFVVDNALVCPGTFRLKDGSATFLGFAFLI